MRTIVLNLLKITILGVILYFLSQKIDLPTFLNYFKKVDLGYTFCAFFINWLGISAIALRWKLIVDLQTDQTYPYYTSLTNIARGFFMNNFLPGNIGGDFYRIYDLKKIVSLKRATFLVFLDRLLGLMFFLLSACFSILWFYEILIIHPLGVLAVKGVSIFLFAFCLGVIGFKPLRRRFSIIKRLDPFILPFLNSKKSFLIVLCSLISIGSFFLMVYFIALSMNLTLSLMTVILVSSIMTLLAVLPISYGGWGIRETGYPLILGLFGIDFQAAVAFSVWVGIVSLLTSLPCGLFFLGALRKEKMSISSV